MNQTVIIVSISIFATLCFIAKVNSVLKRRKVARNTKGQFAKVKIAKATRRTYEFIEIEANKFIRI